MPSHETACILNIGDVDVHVRIAVFFAPSEAVRTHPLRVPEPPRPLQQSDRPGADPRATDYSPVLVHAVVQHTHLDSRQAENALLTTIAHPHRDAFRAPPGDQRHVFCSGEVTMRPSQAIRGAVVLLVLPGAALVAAHFRMFVTAVIRGPYEALVMTQQQG